MYPNQQYNQPGRGTGAPHPPYPQQQQQQYGVAGGFGG